MPFGQTLSASWNTDACVPLIAAFVQQPWITPTNQRGRWRPPRSPPPGPGQVGFWLARCTRTSGLEHRKVVAAEQPDLAMTTHPAQEVAGVQTAQ